MTARDDYPFDDMADPWMTWRQLCEEIDRLQAKVDELLRKGREYLILAQQDDADYRNMRTRER